MKANELRIGNYINPRSNAEVSAWTLYQMSVRRNTGETETIEPILLDEEWLVKFGFESKKIGYNDFEMEKEFIKEEFSIIKYNQGDFCYEVAYLDKNINLKYVHQLQNLYFALTGEELTIKTK